MFFRVSTPTCQLQQIDQAASWVVNAHAVDGSRSSRMCPVLLPLHVVWEHIALSSRYLAEQGTLW